MLLPFKCAILIQLKVDNLFKVSRNFFQLPENVKKGYPRDRENFDGYTGRDQEM
jgi:isopenicillin N synthase-like dioxygenase